MSIEMYASSFNQRLPLEIFDTKIIPLLLDEEDPASIAILSQVCRLWKQVMNSEAPFSEKIREPGFLKRNPEIADLRQLYQSDRKAYLSKFPKSLFEKMQVAYRNCEENTSNLEAKFLFPVCLGLPFTWDMQIFIGEYLGMNAMFIPPTTMALSAIPANLSLSAVDFNYTAFKIGMISLSSTALLALSYSIGLYYDQDYLRDVKEPFLISLYTLISCGYFLGQVEGDSLLSRSYRVAKASLAACVPVAKKLTRSIRQIFFNPKN